MATAIPRALQLALVVALAICAKAAAAEEPAVTLSADGLVVSATVVHDSPTRVRYSRRAPIIPDAPERVMMYKPDGPQPKKTLTTTEDAACPQGAATADGGVAPSANGVAGLSYSDSRFGFKGADFAISAQWSGKMTFSIGGGTYLCSATLIGKSLLLTAAHCVSDFGKGSAGVATNIVFYPQAYYDGARRANIAPIGSWTGKRVLVPASYLAGTDTCDSAAKGVVCNNDLALVELNLGGLSGESKQASDKTGGFANYGWNFYGAATPSATFDVSGPRLTSITQLGYPGAFDNGNTMQISTGVAYEWTTTATTNGKTLKQYLRGSGMTGGSSGGPWIVNFGTNAALTSGTTYGQQANRNVIVGVTSWGYDGDTVKQQGVSAFAQNQEYPNAAYGTSPNRGAGNIGFLVNQACDVLWKLQAAGKCR